MKRWVTVMGLMLMMSGMALGQQTWKDETLRYALYIGPLKAGEASFMTRNTTFEGQKVVRMDLIAKTTSAAEKIFSMNDTLTTYLDAENVRPVYFRKHCFEGDDRYEEFARFSYGQDGTCNARMRKNYKSGRVKERTESSKVAVYDMVSVMGYAKSIAALGNLQAKDGNPIGWEGQTRRAPKAAIATLMSTKWSQTEPYYNMCPVYEGEGDNKGKLCVTGCTCTATAQVMAYHKWPKEACKAVPGYKLELWQGDVKTGYQTLPDLPPVVFQWDKMLDEYHQGEQLIGTKEQQDAVAQLMRYAGQGMKMNYSPEESGTNPFMAADALKKYFGYDQGLQDVSRAHYGIAEWEDLIYNELAAQRPVI